mgnify:CR=1 FL=1|jgi:hypothetical protein
MPLYDLMNTETGEYIEKMCSLSEKELFLKENPHFKQVVLGAPGLVGGHGDRTKPDGGFKEVLSKISESNPNSALANTYGKKDSKSVKIRNAVQKHTGGKL